MAEFPAPISLSAITALLGVLITTVVLLLQNRKTKVLASSLISFGNLVGYSVLVSSSRSFVDIKHNQLVYGWLVIMYIVFEMVRQGQ